MGGRDKPAMTLKGLRDELASGLSSGNPRRWLSRMEHDSQDADFA
jgi:hypothetical protein